MAFYLVGGRGRLGRAIAAEYAGDELVALDRALYADWSRDGAADAVSRYFEPFADRPATVFVASGLLDPALPSQELASVNYELPRNVIEGATRLGVKVVTFGTVMEGLLQSKNPYIRSKTELSDFVQAMAAERQPVVHVQLHTLYGIGQPSPFMFLGQMLSAIETDQPFRMTSGRQLREYHHLADDAAAIRRIAELAAPGIVNLSHGRPVALRALAETVFDALGKSHLLQVGALPEPPEENYDRILQTQDVIQDVHFRDSLSAVADYMRNCYDSKKTRP